MTKIQKSRYQAIAEIRTAYFAGQGSIRELAKKYGVPLRTVDRYSSKEGWRKQIQSLGSVVASTAHAVAERRGEELADAVLSWKGREYRVATSVMDKIEALLPIAGPATVRGITGAAKDASDLARRGLGIAEEQQVTQQSPVLLVLAHYGSSESAIAALHGQQDQQVIDITGEPLGLNG